MTDSVAKRCPNGKLWSGAELAYLDAHKDDAPADIACSLGRSKDSVRNMMLRKGYWKRTRHARGWTDAEDDYLYQRYGRTSAAAIGAHLKRSEESVKHRAAVLGLRAYDEYISLRELGRVFSADLRMIHRWIDQYGMPAVKTKHGAEYYWRVDADAFWTWAHDHIELIPWHAYDGSLPDEPAWVESAVENDRAVNHRAPITRAVKKQAQALYMAGKDVGSIAEIMGRTVHSVRHILRMPYAG